MYKLILNFSIVLLKSLEKFDRKFGLLKRKLSLKKLSMKKYITLNIHAILMKLCTRFEVEITNMSTI